MGIYDLSSSQFAELTRVMDVYDDEAHRCLEADAYLAGCAMFAAELETVLLLYASLHPEDLDASPASPIRKGKLKTLVEWNLWELLAVARDRGWLPPHLDRESDSDGGLSRATQYMEVVRKVRNFIHPARYIQDLPGGRVQEKELEICNQVIDDLIDYLSGILGPAIHGGEQH